VKKRTLCVSTVLVLAHTALAQPTEAPPDDASSAQPVAPETPPPEPPPAEPAPTPTVPANAPAVTTEWSDPAADDSTTDSLQIHGWMSQGAMMSTGNNYLAYTKRGSFEFFEAGLNVTKELGTDIRAGVQLFAQDLGPVGNYKPIVDWAYVDYKLRPWLGIRAGHFKMPLFLYSDQLDADMSRTTVLMPQAVYDSHFRQLLAAVSGVNIYGQVELGAAGSLEYDAYVGTLFSELYGDDWDVENLVGTRIVWNTPVPCVRAAGHVLRSRWHETWTLDDGSRDAVKMSGAVPPDWDGRVTATADGWTMAGGALECETERMTLTAEASWWRADVSVAPALQMPYEFDQLRAYVQASFRVTDRLSTSLYTSILRDSQGGQDPSDDANHQYDTAATVRFDVTPNLLVKAEAHAIDGYAATEGNLNRGEERASRWGLFLMKTTHTF
jgi:hypothetical protein